MWPYTTCTQSGVPFHGIPGGTYTYPSKKQNHVYKVLNVNTTRGITCLRIVLLFYEIMVERRTWYNTSANSVRCTRRVCGVCITPGGYTHVVYIPHCAYVCVFFFVIMCVHVMRESQERFDRILPTHYIVDHFKQTQRTRYSIHTVLRSRNRLTPRDPDFSKELNFY